ncbi:hypothetical protein BJV78DRAFT_1273664 [Lactifluus subvellereus]|nr:hypothetical protein BJV78DRAFT_1273664 [Lactifluus subvellereus]
MAPTPQISSRDTPADGSKSIPIPPMVIAGIAIAGATLVAVGLWLGIRAYRKWSRKRREKERQSAFLTIKGVMSKNDEKGLPPRQVATSVKLNAVIGLPNQFSREKLTASIVMPSRDIVRPDATKDEILHYHFENGTMTRPFSIAASSTLAPPSPVALSSRPVSIVSFMSTGTATSPRRNSFFNFGNRPLSTVSSFSVASSFRGVEGRKVRQLFAPVLPDELVLSLGEKVTVVKSFDDGWCIVGRDSPLKPGEVEMGAVPAWCFIKPAKGLKASRPIRTFSLGVTVQLDAGSGFSSRDELISWSNF